MYSEFFPAFQTTQTMDVDVMYRNPLHRYCMNVKDVKVDEMKELITNGCDINATDRWGETPLHIAAREGNLEMIKTLLEAGCSLEMQSTMCGNTAFHEACILGNLPSVKLFLEHGQQLEVFNVQGNTPIIEACRAENQDVVVALICRGADVDYFPMSGMSARDYINSNFKESFEQMKKKNM